MLVRVALTDFRNYPAAQLELSPGVTVLFGDNGQGKTNFLEAVQLLAVGVSPRPGGPEAWVREGAESAWLRATEEREGRPVDVALQIPRQGRSKASVNGNRTRRRSDALGFVRAVLFSPDDLALVKAGPGGRRLFLDATSVLLRPAAADRQAELERVLRQRTALLRSAKGRGRPSSLAAWDEQLVDHGMSVLGDRLDTLAQAAPLAEALHADLTAGAGKVKLSYKLSWGAVLAPGEEASEDDFRAALEGAERAERERAVCLVGPHRDDLVISLDEREARLSASQGEARTIALALRLAIHQLATGPLGPPVLLLDDVVSELDPRRADALLCRLPGAQTVITTAEPPERLPLAPGARLVRVVGGRLEDM